MNEKRARLLGFRVSNLFVPRFLHTLETGPDFPLTTWSTCPADGVSLKTLCTFVGSGGAKKIRIGCCPSCGYVGYVDTPTQEWLDTYYADTWDQAKRKKETITAEIEKLASLPGKLSHMGLTKEELEGLGVDKNRPVLEIGGGLDRVPKGLQEIGYKKIVAVDASKHRADTTSKAFGITVIPHPFEHKGAQNEFKKHSPFSIIYSSHVIEHMHDPGKVIKLCGELQNTGDYLIFALPNMKKDVAGMILFYISHLHNFTHFSFKRMLGKYGYRVVKMSDPDNKDIFVVAKKESAPIEIYEDETCNHYDETLEKYIAELDLKKKHLAKHRLWWWMKIIFKEDTQSPLWSKWWPIPLLQYYFYSKIYFKRKYREELVASFGEHAFSKNPTHYSSIRACLVRNLSKRHTTYEESPIEIQFDNNILFFYK